MTLVDFQYIALKEISYARPFINGRINWDLFESLESGNVWKVHEEGDIRLYLIIDYHINWAMFEMRIGDEKFQSMLDYEEIDRSETWALNRLLDMVIINAKSSGKH